VGAWPLDLELDDRAGRADFAKRLIGWQEKALREAKLRSDWSQPNQAYEAAARDFVLHLIADGRYLVLLTDIFAFIQGVAAIGAVNGLAQVALKLTVPGVPDLYQGTEYWDFSLVDPDNRRPVDFTVRKKTLAATPLGTALASWRDGRIKQILVHRLLALRRARPGLFALGRYEPIDAPDHVVAFRRRHGGDTVCVAVPRLPGRLIGNPAELRLNKGQEFEISDAPELFERQMPLAVFSTFAPSV
jgi:(1->4)-alpha-D-glucan 1-alpha-D-glucosylmutase